MKKTNFLKVFVVLCALASFVLSSRTLFQEPADGKYVAYDGNFFSSENKIVNAGLWFQRTMMFSEQEIDGRTVWSCPNSIGILFAILFIFALYVVVQSGLKSEKTDPTNKTFLAVCQVWTYLFSVYYTFITFWWMYQWLLGNYLFHK